MENTTESKFLNISMLQGKTAEQPREVMHFGVITRLSMSSDKINLGSYAFFFFIGCLRSNYKK